MIGLKSILTASHISGRDSVKKALAKLPMVSI